YGISARLQGCHSLVILTVTCRQTTICPGKEGCSDLYLPPADWRAVDADQSVAGGHNLDWLDSRISSRRAGLNRTRPAPGPRPLPPWFCFSSGDCPLDACRRSRNCFLVHPPI